MKMNVRSRTDHPTVGRIPMRHIVGYADNTRLGTDGDPNFASHAKDETDETRSKKSEVNKKEMDFLAYARSVFQQSLITSFPEIASSKGWIKRSIKIAVFCACVFGFVYQTMDFLGIYYAYPTVVNVEVFNPYQVKQPAITVCNRNRYRRSIYCTSQPEKCLFFNPKTLCKMHRQICSDSEETYPGLPIMYVYLDDRPEWEKAINYSHKANMIFRCTKTIEGQEEQCDGNYRRIPAVTSYGDPNFCYTIESQWGDIHSNDDIHPNTFTIVLDLNTEPEEYIIVTEPITIQMAIHDRRKLVNPYAEGYALSGGIIYDLYISMSEKELLPYPYATNCTDYMKLWKERNGTGPLNEMQCIEECKLNTLLEQGKCIDRNVAYPHTHTLCQKDNFTVTREIVEDCTKLCGNPCYDQQYELRFEEVGNFDGTCISERCRLAKIRITMFFKRFRVTKFKHEAKFAPVEMFSYIGGYMGMWLGLSLVSFFDLFQTILALAYFPLGKLRKKRASLRVKNISNRRIPGINHY